MVNKNIINVKKVIMLTVKKIMYFYEDGTRKVEYPDNIKVKSREQLEILRRELIKKNNCHSISFIYEQDSRK